ncbi:AAA family ATPase, partial [Agrobacterium tumefaciens]|uniref:AAA family ATPase n=1 Tax=Agrobacterium tumefaciens TaxID=358 RepID=UPI003B9FFE15
MTKSNADDPGFDTTMSAGDKNTFALAFFLSQLKRDPDIANKIVVFDDPFTSLDDFRRAMTAKEIARTGEPSRAAQVILLSHDKFFLEAVRGMIHGATCTPLQISASASGSSIEPWDVEREVKEGYLQDHMRLQDFAEGRSGDARDIRMMMRPLLEKYIRYRFPNQILEGKWLGDMLASIRGDTAHPLAPQYSELDDINGYTAPFHHDPNTLFVEDEVRTYA